MSAITKPILLDSTGQDIVEALETIAENMGTSAGHTIQNDSGTDMQRRDKLQFKGVYVEDDQTNDVTKVDICRTMTKAQMEALSGEALKGFINTSDEPDSLPLTAEWVGYGNGSVKDALDNKVSKTGDTIEGNLDIDRKNGTAGAEGNTYLNLGNNIPKSSAGNSTGNLRVYGDTGYGVVLNTVNNMTGNQYASLPNKSGTIALTSDIPSVIPKQVLGNITSSFLDNAYTDDFIKIGYLFDSGLPLYGNWGMVICVAGASGTTKVCNQVIIAQNGIATRHYEGSSWSAWKKTSFS